VDQEIEAAPALIEGREQLVEAGRIGHVGRQHERRADLLGERPHALAERIALVGDGELGAVRGERARDPPGERALIGDAHDQAPLARHQGRGVGHRRALLDSDQSERHPSGG
jgi:hypothetical protein